jgi:esterase/lipase
MYADGLLVYNHLKNKFKEKNIVVYCYSLGSTFATKIAAVNAPKELVLQYEKGY